MLRNCVGLMALVAVVSATAQETLVPTGSFWRWRKGTNEVSSPTTAWRNNGFNDSAWTIGSAPFHYGTNPSGGDDGVTTGTILSDMRGNYRGVYLRTTFTLSDISNIASVQLLANYDDGFVAWINGVEVARANVTGNPLYTTQASGSHEADPAVAFTATPSPQSYLVTGLNVLAVQALNINISSSTDFRFETSLSVVRADLSVPKVLNSSPAAGATVGSLGQITVVFSKPVFGVDASDLLVNGQSAASVSGSGNSYTFTFTQPPPGPVNIGWNEGPLISDSIGNAFDPFAAGSTWSYTLTDTVAPVVGEMTPVAGSTLGKLTRLEVAFSEAVRGVDAADLRINGVPATSVSGSEAGPYVFQFPQPAAGTVQFAWAAGHGITDTAATPNAFAGGTWSVVLNPGLQPGDVVINEFVAANRTGILDEDGEAQDWIELRNRGTNTVNLLGWSLTDDKDAPGKWAFPSVTLAPGQYLYLFASGKDRKAPANGQRFHTNFKLNPAGDYLALFNAESPRTAATEFAPRFPEQRNDRAYGRDNNDVWRYFPASSPGVVNGFSSIVGLATEPHFNVGSGWFDVPFNVVLSSSTPGGILRYTTDGTEPTDTTGTVYTGPIQVTNTATLRAAVFGPGLLPSRVKTRTYLFMDAVVAQPNNPAGFPSTWGSNGAFPGGIIPADYEMDLDPVRVDPNNPASAVDPVKLARLKGGLRELPIVSIVMKTDDMFGDGGLYPTSSSGNKNKNDKECSVEMILPDGTSAFSVDCGIRLHGNASRDPNKNPKHGFKLVFKGDYGPSDLEYRLFEDSSAEKFDDLILRPDFGVSWRHWSDVATEGGGAFQRSRASRIRDAWWKETMRDLGRVASHSRFCQLFINGLYWGTYDFTEQPTDTFAANYFGGTKADYDIYDQGGLSVGTSAAYNTMLAIDGLSQLSNYELMKQSLDVPEFIDYMLMQFFVGAQDWGNNKNWFALRKRAAGPEGTFKYLPWDGENILLDENINRVSNSDVPSNLHTKLDDSAEYRLEFADHVQRHLFTPGGALTAEGNIARWQKWQAIIDKGIVGESARWGDYRRDVHPYQNGAYVLYTREDQWMAENNRLVGSYFVNRPTIVSNQLRSAGLYPTTAAPAFNQHGGRVAPGFALAITAPAGTIYYTTNGVDPRVYGTGTVSPSARSYAASIPLDATMTVKARVLSGGSWSALVEAVFSVGELGLPLRFTEIMYNPPGGDAYEFLELRNIGAQPVDIGRFSLQGVSFLFTEGTVLAPGTTFLLASGANTNAFKARYPGAVFQGVFGGNLSNGGERLALLDRAGATVTAVNYDDENGWPLAADGGGASLEVLDVNGDPDSPANWRASTQANGTPGLPPQPAALASIRLNEVMADNLSAVVNGGIYPDWIELENTGPSTVDLGGWSLSDNDDPRAFVFPAGTMLGSGNRIVVWCDSAFAAPGLHAGFALSRSGDAVFLYDPATNRVDAVRFGAQITDLSLGRIDGVWRLNRPTPIGTNAPVALAAPGQLAVNEWLADAVAGQSDWIELFNRSTTAPAALSGLYLGNGATLQRVHALSFIPPGGHLRLYADEGAGPDHLQFKLPAAGGQIVLFDATGAELERVAYGAQAEGVSQGRLPDGSPNIVSFPGSPSPGATNYISGYSGPVLNEVLARNQRATVAPWGGYADWVELQNPGASAVDLGGMALGLKEDGGGRWTIPAGTTIGAGGHLLVWCDGDRAASASTGSALNSGFSLPGDSGDVLLFNAAGQIVDRVGYGFQLTDRSIGRSGAVWRLLASPTPAAPNAAPASLGSVGALRVNEWMAVPLSGDDWFELFNTDSQPVDLGGLFVTDDPSSVGLVRNPIAPLSFIDGRKWVRFVADGGVAKGREHVAFSLDGQGETLRLYTTNLALIDAIDFGLQTSGVSQGRLPDGAAGIVWFTATPTPNGANYLPLDEVVINEVLAHTDPPLEDAIELFNPGAANVAIGGWYLSDTASDLKRYRIPDGATVPAGGYRVFYQNQFGPADGESDAPPLFTLNSAHGDQVHLSEADALGNLTGRRASISFGASSNGVAIGRWPTSVGVDFTAMASRTFGVDSPSTVAEFRTGSGKTNSLPLVGPVVIHEILYHPAPLGPGEPVGADAEFIELHNLSASAVALYDPVRPTNVWQLADGVRFNFPANTSIPAGGHLVVVPFDPVTNAAAKAAFQSRHGTTASLVGPFSGQLDNAGEAVELLRPDVPQAPPHPDAGFVPYLRVDRVVYGPAAPWPTVANGGGASLQRIAAASYGNDPVNWKAEAPTAGRANTGLAGEAPVVTVPPVDLVLAVGSSGGFTVTVTGTAPLAYQWYRNDVALNGKTAASLDFAPVASGDSGTYRVRATNAFGAVFSANATLTVVVPPVITVEPADLAVVSGTTATFTMTATGSEPLAYRWQREGVALSAPSQNSLVLSGVSPANSGGYRVVVTNFAGAVTSRVATLSVKVPPTITGHPDGIMATEGDDVSLTVSATGDAPLAYQWKHGSDDIPGATGSTLRLNPLRLSDAGTYSVRVSNAAGSQTSQSAEVMVVAAVRFSAPQRLGDGRFMSLLSGPPSQLYWIDMSTNLANWAELSLLTLSNTPSIFLDGDAPQSDKRFYRARKAD